MSRRARAANEVSRTVVDYLPEQRGAFTASALASRIGREVQGAPRVIERTPTYYGVVARDLQRFTGAAGLGAAQIYAPRSSQMNQQVSSTDSATAAVFYARMTRGK